MLALAYVRMERKGKSVYTNPDNIDFKYSYGTVREAKAVLGHSNDLSSLASVGLEGFICNSHVGWLKLHNTWKR